MSIPLTKPQIEVALPKVAQGLAQYRWLQANLKIVDVRASPLFRARFNHFYRVRRNHEWQNMFYEILESLKEEGQTVEFSFVLISLFQATDRFEASFASKLLATINPGMPVIDSVVLRNLSLRLPYPHSIDRLERTLELHAKLRLSFLEFLESENGRYLVKRFLERYEGDEVTETKMLDLVLWQSRPVSKS
jgi:hypothetical protein